MATTKELQESQGKVQALLFGHTPGNGEHIRPHPADVLVLASSATPQTALTTQLWNQATRIYDEPGDMDLKGMTIASDDAKALLAMPMSANGIPLPAPGLPSVSVPGNSNNRPDGHGGEWRPEDGSQGRGDGAAPISAPIGAVPVVSSQPATEAA